MSRLESLAILAVCLTAQFLGASAAASAQSLTTHPSCDGANGSSMIGRAPAEISPAAVSMLIIFPSGEIGTQYEESLRDALSPPHITGVDDFRAYQQRIQTAADNIPLLFSLARYARVDGNGYIACRGVEAGRYDVLLGANGSRSQQTGSRMHFFVAHAVVPPAAQKNLIVRISDFREITGQ